MSDDSSRAGTRYADEAIRSFVDQVHAPHDEALEDAFSAPQATGLPAIQLAQSEGRMLELFARLCAAKRVVEVGTLAGYSAIRLARGMQPDGHLWTIEYDARHADVARERIAAAGFADRVTVIVGAGVEVLPTLEEHGPFDLVFVDADKESYASYGAWAAEHLRPGGLLVGDNAYLFGNLMSDTDRAAAMRSFHEQAAARFESVCIPTPDGMVLAIKR